MQQLPVESVGMVEINLMSFFVGHARRIIIIRIEWNYGYEMRWQDLYYFSYNGRFATASGTGNTDDCDFIFRNILTKISLNIIR